jgi:predicted porin
LEIKNMKKSFVLLAIAGAFSGVVHAQSAVELYGVVDMGFVNQSGAPSGLQNKLTSGVQSGSRLGFKGTEDLGSGMKGLFVLETGIAVDAGGFNQSNTAFARQSFLGLQSDMGTLTLGRQYTSYFLTLSQVGDPFAAGLAGNAQNLMLPATGIESDRSIRMSNAIKYATPVISNFSAEVAYGFGELSGSNGARRVLTGSIGYSLDPLNIRLAHYRKNNDADTDHIASTILAANWNLGVAKVFAAYADNDWLAAGKSRDMLVGATVPFGAHTFIVSYINKEGRGSAAGNDANQWALGYTYALSKRTNLYASWARINNDGAAVFTVGNNSEAGVSDKAFNIGVRHLF